MKLERRTLLTGFALLLAFIIGRYLLPDPTSGLTGLPGGVVDAVRAWKGAGVSEAELAPRAPMRRRIDRLQTKSDHIPAAVAQALRVGDPVDHHQRITDYLAKIDTANWEAVIDQFQFVSHQTGRTDDDLWNLAMVRIGQIAGESAMTEMRARGFDQDQILYGWAMTDPGAAKEWMETTGKTDKARGRFLQQLISGLAVADPALATQYMSTLDESEQRFCTGSLVKTLIQGGGIDSASHWLDQVLVSPASPELARQSFEEVARSVARTSTPDASGPGFAQDWFLRYGNSEWITTDTIGTAASRYQGEYAVNGLDFLLAVNKLPVLQQHSDYPPGLESVIQNAYRASPESLEQWFQTHPSAPFRDGAMRYYETLRGTGQ
jgi:hypothetical protein